MALLHEAAHTVARAALNLPFCAVEVDGFGLGLTHGSGEPILTSVNAKVAMAGQAIETRFFPVPEERMFERWIASCNAAADQDDEYDVDDAGQAGLFAAEGYRWAIGLLDTHWNHVERVAQSLAIRNELNAGEVRALLAHVDFDHGAISRAAETDPLFFQRWFAVWLANLAERRALEVS